MWHFKVKPTQYFFSFSDNGYMDGFLKPSSMGQLLEHIEYTALDGESWQTVFARRVKQYPLKSSRIVWILQPQQYQLLQCDDLPVPDDELRQAALWRARELLDVNIADLAVDVFRIPPHGPGQQRKIMSLVVAQKALLTSVNEMVMSYGCNIETIDISELVLQKVSSMFMPEVTSSVSLFFHPFATQLLCVEQSQLYFYRDLDFAFESLADPNSYDTLLLQMQRSFDYYTRQFSRSLPLHLCVSPLMETHPLVALLKQTFSLSVIIQDWNSVLRRLNIRCDIPLPLQQKTLWILAALLHVGSS